MHMILIFLFIQGNKDLMTMEWLSGSNFCAKGQVIKQAHELNPTTLPPRCTKLEKVVMDVKLIFMSSPLAKASTKLQYYRRRA
jgi:hypothetical protein